MQHVISKCGVAFQNCFCEYRNVSYDSQIHHFFLTWICESKNVSYGFKMLRCFPNLNLRFKQRCWNYQNGKHEHKKLTCPSWANPVKPDASRFNAVLRNRSLQIIWDQIGNQKGCPLNFRAMEIVYCKAQISRSDWSKRKWRRGIQPAGQIRSFGITNRSPEA